MADCRRVGAAWVFAQSEPAALLSGSIPSDLALVYFLVRFRNPQPSEEIPT
jgi:hypothetical protein